MPIWEVEVVFSGMQKVTVEADDDLEAMIEAENIVFDITADMSEWEDGTDVEARNAVCVSEPVGV